MNGQTPCSYPSHRSSDWQLAPGSQPVCGVCHPRPPGLGQPVARGSRAVLAECEAVIARGLATFIEVGQALLRIRDERLYRETYSTFEDYCRERWDFSRPRANQLMQAAEVGALSTTVDTPLPSERVARALAPLRDEPDEMRQAWAEAIELHGEKPTAAQVREVVAARVARESVPLLAESDAEILGFLAIARDGEESAEQALEVVDERRNGHRPEHVGRPAADARRDFPDVLAVVVLGREPRILAWQPLPRADDLSDLDLEHARRYLAEKEAERRNGDLRPPPCRCPRPVPDGEGGCVLCGRELRGS